MTNFGSDMKQHMTAPKNHVDENQLSTEDLLKALKELNEGVSGIGSLLSQAQQPIVELRGENESLQSSNHQLQQEIARLKEELSEAKRLNEQQALLLEENSPGVIEPRKNPTIGIFSTTEVRPTDPPNRKTSKLIQFVRPYSVPPGLVLGLAKFSIGNEFDIRISCFARTLTTGGFELNIDGSAKTKIYQGSCAWLEIEADDPDFQFGRFSTLEDHPWDSEKTNQRQVIFSRPYTSSPQVAVWLTAVDLGREKNWRLKTYASHITSTGFTIHINTCDTTVFRSATASWVAYPSGKEGVCNGRFHTDDMRPSSSPQLYNSGYSTFPTGVFTSTPRIFMALDYLDFDSCNDMRLEVKATTITAAGMLWHLNSWNTTKLHGAGASYIALS